LTVRAILFDLFETLITESGTRPAGVSSLAPRLGCDRAAFRARWKAVRPAVLIGRVPFCQALSGIASTLGGFATSDELQRIRDERIRIKTQPFEHIEHEVLRTLTHLRGRNIRLGIVSNCFEEDVMAWPRSALAPLVDCAVFSCEVGLAKPEPAIYVEAARRLSADVAGTWFIGDGGDDELSGAEQAGVRAFRALWFLKRWPHYRDEPHPIPGVARIDDVVRLVGSPE
jgi:putative hydrolase of the HAD superfamily